MSPGDNYHGHCIDIKSAKQVRLAHAKRNPKIEKASDSLPEIAIANSTFTSGVFDAEVRRALIAAAAYQRAAQRGFAPDGELADWLAAEVEIDARLCGETQSL